MTAAWLDLTAFLGGHPLLALSLAAGAAGGAAAVHVWRLRARERQLTRLADQRNRLWQAEPVARVLVVGEHRERRGAMKAAFDDLGITPAFADSHWAATVAAHHAESEGAPYDLILVDAALEGTEGPTAPAGTAGEVQAAEGLAV